MPLLQTSTAGQPAAAPNAPTAPGKPVGAQIGETQVVFDVPKTSADLAALRKRASTLSDQLGNVTRRRSDVARELNRASEGVARQGLEDRLRVLDQRIAQIEKDIEVNSRLIANAPLSRVLQEATTEPTLAPGQLSAGQITGISIVGTIAVGMPLAIGIARTIFKRVGAPKPAPQILESAQRLERMEQAIDAMAVEVERISEGQRFVTQLMAPKEKAPASLPASDSVVR